MKQLVKFLNLTTAERNLLVSALFRLVAIRIGLWVLPLQVILRRLETLKVSKTFRVCTPEQIAWAIRLVSRYLPGTGNCLVQSLAARAMLARQGYLPHLRIGAAKDESGGFKAHAWVECDGRIIIGAVGVSQFTPFPDLKVRHR